MINEITLIGFKSFLNRRLPLNRLTVLTGINSSGKSSVIQALLMLEKSVKVESGLMLDGHGTIEEVKNPYSEKMLISVKDDDDKSLGLEFINVPSLAGYTVQQSDDKLDFPEIIYISASRFGPKPFIPIYSDLFKKIKIGYNGENLLQCIEFHADVILNPILKHENSEGDTLLYNIRGWLSVIAPNVEFKYKVDKTSDSSYSTFNEHRSANVGFGLTYVLPVITALLLGTTVHNGLVIIENPEAHLHPKGQTEIARLISLCTQTGTQVIIETHSDHVFDGIRIAAKNTPDFADNVQIHWFELNEKNNTEVYSPMLYSDGRLSEWPNGLFDQFEINVQKLL